MNASEAITEGGACNNPDSPNVLFAIQKISGASGSLDLATTAIANQWWAHMADIMETNPDNSPVAVPLQEALHME